MERPYFSVLGCHKTLASRLQNRQMPQPASTPDVNKARFGGKREDNFRRFFNFGIDVPCLLKSLNGHFEDVPNYGYVIV